MLQMQFADDQTLKEQAKLTAIKREKRETISLKDTKPETNDVQDDEDDFDVSILEKVKNTPVEPVVVAETTSVTETPVEKTPDESPAINQAKTIGEVDVQIQVIGKIDLDKINSKTRPDKKKKEDKKPTKENQPTPTAKQEPAKPVAQEKIVETPKAVETPKEAPVVEAPKEIETIRVERKVLSGPTVLGRIELPVEKPKTSDNKGGQKPGDEPRKKRKRIKKIDPAKVAQQNTPGNQQNQQGGGNNKKGNNKFGNRPNPNAPKVAPTEKDIQKEINDTLARLSNSGGKSKASKNRRAKRDSIMQRREQEMIDAEMQEKILKLTEFVTVSELAAMMNVSPTQVISACMSLGIFASINQRLDAETIHIIAEEFGFETEFVSAEVQEAIPTVEDREEDLISRPPIVKLDTLTTLKQR